MPFFSLDRETQLAILTVEKVLLASSNARIAVFTVKNLKFNALSIIKATYFTVISCKFDLTVLAELLFGLFYIAVSAFNVFDIVSIKFMVLLSVVAISTAYKLSFSTLNTL
jgi:hypothetical protein